MKDNIMLVNKLLESGIPIGRLVSLVGISEGPTRDMEKILCARLISQEKCLLGELVKDIKKKSL